MDQLNLLLKHNGDYNEGEEEDGLYDKLTSNRPLLFPKYLQLPHPTSTKIEPNGKDCTNDSTLGQGL